MQRGSWPVAVVVAGLATAGAALAVPEVTTPDFERGTAVRTSVKVMYDLSRKEAQKTGDWRARRAAGECRNALQLLDWRQTSSAYDAEAGARIWRFCHDAYARLR